MPVLAILAIFPLMMAVLFGPPKLARTSEPVPPPPPALEDATFVASPTLAALSFDPAPADDQASAGPTADTGAAPEVSFDAQPHESLALMSSGTLPTLSAPVLAGAAPKPELPVLKPATPPPAVTSPFTSLLNLLKPPRLVMQAGGPAPINAQQIVSNAEALMGVPYVWGGNTTGGLDCSAFVSRVWGVGRRTTDTLPGVAFKISKDELLPGDILDLTIAADPEHYGHVRLFAGWANSDHSRMWVYEETPPRSVHHMIAYDARYQPLRRVNFSPGDLTAASLVNMLFGKASPAAAADVGDDSGDSSADGNGPAPFVSTPLQPHPTLEALVGAFGSDVWTPTWPDQQPAAPSHGWSWLPHVSLPWTAPAPKAAVQLAGLEIIPARQPVSSILPIPAPSSWSSSAHHWHWDGSP
ncbi:MAG TPA: NlpC/P60 family protein, partial [Chloroflexota bacterium]|nr:NlpC/P60 family protein [Chloroflexota bacterium]